MYVCDAKFLNQIAKCEAAMENMLQVSDTFVFPDAEFNCFFVTGEVWVIPDWGES